MRQCLTNETGEEIINMAANFFISTSRIEAFSDGVFAIIITLLILEIKAPELTPGVSIHRNWVELLKVAPKFISFVLSFLFIAIFWTNHHQLFHSIKEADRGLLWYNVHLLFWITIIPFPTAMIGDHPLIPMAVMSLAFVLLMASLASYLIARHAHFTADLMHETLSKVSKEKAIQKSLIGIALYFLAIITALASVYISYAIFLLALGIFIVPQQLVRRNKSLINK